MPINPLWEPLSRLSSGSSGCCHSGSRPKSGRVAWGVRRVAKVARRRNGGGAAYDRLSVGERERLVGSVLVLAIVTAPFLALLYDLDATLAMIALALGATAALAAQAARSGTGGPALRPRLLTAAALNALLALACLVILLVRL